ncbi:MAG: carbonate dehydratase [Acidobacteriota bacterium]
MSAAAISCHHCGLPVPAGAPWRLELDGAIHPLCCAGCDAVAHAILDAGLVDYYRHRTEPAAPGAALVPAELERLGAWDRPEVARDFVRADGEAREAALLLDNLRCGACVWLAERRLSRCPGVLGAEVNFASRRADVRWDPARTGLAAILAALAEVGLAAHPFDPARSRAALEAERRDRLLRFLVAGALGMQVMVLSEALYAGDFFGIEPEFEGFFRWGSLLLTLPVLVYCGRPFLAGARDDLGHGRVGMDVPVALGLWLAFLGSVWATWSGRGEVYFDSVVMLIFLLLGARLLENGARRQALADVERLERPVPAMATRLGEDGAEESVASAALGAGDRVRIRPGEASPADGVVAAGASRFDEAVLTGESLPVARATGERVLAGAINVESPVDLRVTAAGSETAVASLARLVDRARSSRPALARLADRVAARFSASVLVLTAGAALAWWAIAPERVLPVVVALLVVACPCALALATPLAIAAGSGALARRGFLVTRPHALESLAVAEVVVFDKTGTLTEGRPRLVAVETARGWSRERALCVAAALERGSEHPLAAAIRAAACGLEIPAVEDLVNRPGRGVTATIAGARCALGSPDFVVESEGAVREPGGARPIDGTTPVLLACAGATVARFALADELRPGARELVAELRRTGRQVFLLSGDHLDTVARIARELGGVAFEAAATPERKLERVRELASGGRTVAMVGDGVNDAAALSGAAVSVAMGGGAWMAASAADAVLVSSRPEDLAFAFERAARTLRTIRAGLAQALVYNAIFLPLAALGRMPPWLAAIGMSASSAAVVLVASRLRRERRPRDPRPTEAPAASPGSAPVPA